MPLRLRITAVAVVVVGLALAGGATVLVAMLHSHLLDSSRSSAKARALSVASLLAATPGGDGVTLTALGDDDHEFVQVVDETGTVLAASKNVVGRPAVTDDDQVTVDGEPFVIGHTQVDTAQGRRTVLAGASLEPARDATGSLTRLLLLGWPLMLLVVGGVTWSVVGRTLAPVERIRRETDAIGANQLHRRLPEPERQDEIGRLAHTMNLMLDRLEHSAQQQRRFVSDAAHELRSPVAAIRQNLEVATTYPDHLSMTDLVETVDAESTRLERLVSALLGLARLDERSWVDGVTAVDLDDLVLDEARRLANAGAARIDTSAVGAGRVAGDAGLLSQVVRNLADNALRHARSTIALALSEQGATVTLSVSDDGPGIPVPDRERVFERFVRLDEARAGDDGGSGLGLAIVTAVVTAHGGSVVATSSPLGGACLLVSLPRFVDA